jgi:peptidoglycan/xylan/chitin deacetylase (PgdA/CDA1 family)
MRRAARLGARVVGVPLGLLVLFGLRFTGRRVGIALVYHALAPRSGDPDVELVAPHGEALFERQLRFLARAFRVVDASELSRAVALRRRGQRMPVTVTFDDDLASHLNALAILGRHGVRATFFLTGACLQGPPASFWWQRLQHTARTEPERVAELGREHGAASIHELARRLEQLGPAELAAVEERLVGGEDAESGLRADGVQALARAGMAIGFHTRRHRYLPLLPAGELDAAFVEGRAELEELAGRPLNVVAYPHGAADERVAAAARAAGFEVGYTGRPRAVRAGDDPLLLGRLSPSHRSAGQLGLQLAAALARRG